MHCVSQNQFISGSASVSMKDAFVLINWYKDILPVVCCISILKSQRLPRYSKKKGKKEQGVLRPVTLIGTLSSRNGSLPQHLASCHTWFLSQINRFPPPLRRRSPSFCVRKLQHPYLYCFPSHGNNHQNIWQTEADLYLFWQASENYIRTLQASPGDANNQFCCEIRGTPEGVKKKKGKKNTITEHKLSHFSNFHRLCFKSIPLGQTEYISTSWAVPVLL